MENQNEELVTVVDASIIYQQDKAAIDTMIATAKVYPRNIQRAKKNCVDIVTIDQETAQTCTYSVPRGGKSITGPSVHLAKIIAQQWGNLRIESKVVDISATQVTSEAICFDLETNFAIKTQVKKSIVDSKGKRYRDDMITVTGNACNSIALRNAVFAVIPRPIVDSVYNSAIKTLTGDVSDSTKLKKRAREIVDKMMGAYNVTEAQVLSIIGKASVDFITPEDLTTLIGLGTSIKDGDTTVEMAFSGKKTEDAPKSNVADNTADRLKQLVTSAKNKEALEQILSTMSDANKEFVVQEIAMMMDNFEQSASSEKPKEELFD